MDSIDKLYSAMTKAEREAPATREDLTRFSALMLKHMKALKRRIKQLEKAQS